MLDKDAIFEILREQNYWYREPAPTRYISRKRYLDRITDLLGSKAIVVVRGPRRAGKTVLLDQTIRKMISSGFCGREQILYVGLEDYRFYNHYSVKLLETILETYLENIKSAGTTYFFIDEIQHIDGFEHFLRTKYDSEDSGGNIKFVVTGSNARLLSRELGTLLTGRMVSMEVFPFSFGEFLSFSGTEPSGSAEPAEPANPESLSYFSLEPRRTELRRMFNRYLRYGAIPEFMDDPDPDGRLREYFENVLFRDIVERFKIRNVRQIKELALYLVTNSASLYSLNRLARTFGTSVSTIQTYLSDLELAYLFFYLKQYSASFRKQVTTQSKAYCLDTGLMNAVGFRFSEGRGHLLENLVYVELLRYGKEVYYHRNSSTKKECDFLVKDGLKVVEAIQVCRELESGRTRKREVEGLLDAAREHGLEEGLILTDEVYDSFEQDGVKVRVRPVWFWLLNKEG